MALSAAMVQAIARHILTALAGGLAVKYSLDGNAIEAVIGGFSALAGVIWSLNDKRVKAETT